MGYLDFRKLCPYQLIVPTKIVSTHDELIFLLHFIMLIHCIVLARIMLSCLLIWYVSFQGPNSTLVGGLPGPLWHLQAPSRPRGRPKPPREIGLGGLASHLGLRGRRSPSGRRPPSKRPGAAARGREDSGEARGRLRLGRRGGRKGN